jgi:hypothetical protein
MAKADRLERLDSRRAELEIDYSDTLIAALRTTASGVWGLFDHRQHRIDRARAAPVVEELTDLGEAIDGMRGQLGIGPFALHEEFLASRGPVTPSCVGEPKQAQAWLARLAAG